MARHSYVKFYPSDWLAGTARLPRLLRCMYFDVCLHNWDHGEAMSKSEQKLVFADIEGWQANVQSLIEMGKLKRTKGGGLYSERAINEARSSIERYAIAVASGKHGAAKRWKDKDKSDRDPIGVGVANQNQNQNYKRKEPIGSKKSVSKGWVEGDTPPEEWIGWAQVNMGWTRGQSMNEAQRFIDYSLANRKTYADWLAAWRNWCRSPFQKTVSAKQEALTL